jgi:NAD+ synthetase
MKIAIAQIDSTAGALVENREKILRFAEEAKARGCDLVVFPEMALTGYPICDIVYEPDFLAANKGELAEIAKCVRGINLIVGFIDFNLGVKGEDGSVQKFNSAAFVRNGRIIGVQHKALLPTYDVFDERRFFSPGLEWGIFESCGKRIGITICEDMWDENYACKPVDLLVKKGADMIINISASPFHIGTFFDRKELLLRHAKKGVAMVFANKVGVQDNGQDVLLFDGQSTVLNKKGELIALGQEFEERLVVFDPDAEPIKEPAYDKEAETFNALVFGLKGYAAKCGFSKAVLGLSGGIDSAVVACIAAESFGRKNVLAVAMPSRFSSAGSIEDSRIVAKNLGIDFIEWPIEEIAGLNRRTYKKIFGNELRGTAAENPQARLRGNTLMTISNAQNRLLVSTGNKTEIALGYCTLYGDMAGGLEVIGDLSKTNVYKLAGCINKKMGNPIPRAVIEKAPSAELAPNQFDPFDYKMVSPLVDSIVEATKTKAELLKEFPLEEVLRIKMLVESAQYKRKQAPPVIRVTKKAFGSGRVYPIINKWRW